MAKRKKRETSHDKIVRQEATKLKRKGWDVKAHVSGFPKPKPIGKKKRIPDIEAKKKGATRLIEVETKRSLDQDKDQRSSFARSASQRKKPHSQL